MKGVARAEYSNKPFALSIFMEVLGNIKNYKQLEERLVVLAKDSLKKTYEESKWISKNLTKENITRITNVEFTFGKFHSYMQMLNDINPTLHGKLSGETAITRIEVLENIEKIYDGFED